MAQRVSILTKLLIIMLILTVGPLSIVGYLALNDAKDLGYNTLDNAEQMGEQVIKETEEMGDMAASDATKAMEDLAAEIIQQKAELVAKQLEIYIRENPEMTIEDLQNDAYFQELAVQPVGKTGYTAITDYDSLVCRFHASSNIANMDLHNLEESLPEFWEIMSRTEGGKDAKGFYDWKEDDGSIREKFMYIACINNSVRTADGVGLSVAATTYVDEFTAPIEQTKSKIVEATQQSAQNIKQANQRTQEAIKIRTEGISTQNTIFMITAIAILIVLIVSILFARTITAPVERLTASAKRVINGDFDVKLKVNSNDEIRDLAAAMEMLVAGFKAQKKKAEEVKQK